MGSALKAYSFTFTAGSVGDRVKFSYPVFDAAGDPIDGSVLDSGLKVAVRAVTDGLTAYTVDSLDRPVLSLTATRDDPAVSDALAGAIVPRPTAADAGKVVTVNDAGTGYELDAAAGGGGGGASEPLRATVYFDSAPILGGTMAHIDLDGNLTGSDPNTVAFTVPLWHYAAGHTFKVHVLAPAFSTGTLRVGYAEMVVVSADGSKRVCVGRDAAMDLTSEEDIAITFDDNDESGDGAGSDLTMSGDHVTTAAGGIFQVGVLVRFWPSDDLAA